MSEHLRPILRALAIAVGRLAAVGLLLLIAHWLPWRVDPLLRAAVVGAMAADYVVTVVTFTVRLPHGWLQDGPAVLASLVGPALAVALGAPSFADDGLSVAIGFFAFVLTAGVEGTVWYFREVLAYEA